MISFSLDYFEACISDILSGKHDLRVPRLAGKKRERKRMKKREEEKEKERGKERKRERKRKRKKKREDDEVRKS